MSSTKSRPPPLSASDVTLRPIASNDPKLLETVRVGCFPDAIPKRNDLKGMDHPEDGVSSNFVLEDKKSKETVAFLTADFNKRGKGRSFVQFDNVCTLPAWRGRGAQTLLLHMVRAWYRENQRDSGIFSFNIRIAAKKARLVEFYTSKKRGFQQYHKKGKGKRAMLFTRDLFEKEEPRESKKRRRLA